MKRKLIRPFVLAVTLALFMGAFAVQTTNADDPRPVQTNRLLVSAGTTQVTPAGQGSEGLQFPEFATGLGRAESNRAARPVNRSLTREHASAAKAAAAALSAPVADNTPIVGDNPNLVTSFAGLNHRDQRLANNGNQFSLEPPDQGLCSGGGYVLESVNDALRIYSNKGAALSAVIALNPFYGYPPEIIRGSLNVFGPEPTDPSCYFDHDTARWFHVVLTLETAPKTGALTGKNHLDLAVSTSANPLGSWNIYRIAVQDDGTDGTPKHTDCPCIGDFPHIGADQYGIYLTTNEYPFVGNGQFGNNFNGAQIYAISKAKLAAGAASIPFVHFSSLTVAGTGTPGFTVWPAIAPAGINNTDHNGTEFFLSSMAAEETGNTTGFDNRIAVWALTNSKSLDSNSPAPVLNNRAIRSKVYGTPPLSDQKAGDFPLGQCINDTTTVITSLGPPFTGCWQAFFAAQPKQKEVEGKLDSSDTRMMQVYYADGKLWSALDTVVKVNGAGKAGILFFVVKPEVGGNGQVSAGTRMVKDGYLASAHNNLTYPAVAVWSNGKGVMAFSLLGFNYFPSAAYVLIDKDGTSAIHVAAAGLGPQDGFCEYNVFDCSGSGQNIARPRWGDYGAAVADAENIWIASEYIGQTCTFAQYIAAPFGSCGGTRTSLANWGTRISKVKP